MKGFSESILHKFSFSLVLFPFALILFSCASLSAAIEGVSAVYDYSDFLITDIPLGIVAQKENNEVEYKPSFTIGQKYDHRSLMTTSLAWNNKNFLISSDNSYFKSFNYSNVYLSNRDRHTVSLQHFNFEHKKGLKLFDLNLKDKFCLYNGAVWSLDLNSDFDLIHHFSGRRELSRIGLNEKVGAYTDTRGIEATLYTYDLEDLNHHRSSIEYIQLWDTVLIKAGASLIGSSDVSIYPSVSFRYNVENRWIARIELREELAVYPFKNYFSTPQLLFDSEFDRQKKEISPIRQKSLSFGSELNIYGLSNEFTAAYTVSDEFFNSDWLTNPSGTPTYQIVKFNGNHKYLSFTSNTKYDDFSFLFRFIPLGRTDFTPAFNVEAKKSFIIDALNVFNMKCGFSCLEAESDYFKSIVKSDYNWNGEISHSYTTMSGIVLNGGILWNTARYNNPHHHHNLTAFVSLSFDGN